jgi:hypothetical protein
MNPTPLAPVRRLLLALDAGGTSPAAFETVTALALALHAELAAVFVEDIDLLRLAGLPFAGELGLTSATRRRLQHPEMERALRAQAARAQAVLAELAGQTSLRWTFRVVRGHVGAQVTQAALDADIVTVSLGDEPAQALRRRSVVRQMMVSTSCPLLVLPAGGRLRPPYALLYDGSPAAQRALRLGAQLNRDTGAAMILLLAAAGSQAARLRGEVESLLAEENTRARFRLLDPPGPEALVRLLRAEAAGALLLPVTANLGGADRLGSLLDAGRWATVLVP